MSVPPSRFNTPLSNVKLGTPHFSRTKQRIEIERLSQQSSRLMVWWYGAVKRRASGNQVPQVSIYFRQLDEHDRPAGWVTIECPVTQLGILRIGSVWEAGRLVADRIMDGKREFDVDFSRGRWECVKFGDVLSAIELNQQFKAVNRDTWLLKFPLKSGGHLFIPCLEFFTRCYGRSAEIKRVLTTYAPPEAQTRLFTPLNTPSTSGNWPIRLNPRTVNADAVFLAHLYYDPVATQAAGSIYAQLESASSDVHQGVRPSVALKITPWFEGKAVLVVDGFAMNGDRNPDFLALQVMGCSDPLGQDIETQREHGSHAEQQQPSEAGQNSDLKPEFFQVTTYPPVTVITDEQAPDLSSGTVTVEEQPFGVPGHRRTVIKTDTSGGGNAPRKRVKAGEVPGTLSTGQPHGGGKGVGKSLLHAPERAESLGALQDVFDTLNTLALIHGFQSVQAVTLDNEHEMQFHTGLTLMTLIPKSPVGKENSGIYKRRGWDYLIPGEKNVEDVRGVLVVQVVLGDTLVYVVEVQRRVKEIKKTIEEIQKPVTDPAKPVKPQVEESAMKGLMFTASKGDEANLTAWLSTMRQRIREQKGVMHPIISGSEFAATMTTYMHNHAADEISPYSVALTNQMIKLGFLPEEARQKAYRKPEPTAPEKNGVSILKSDEQPSP